ncbi:MAG: ankyrin repeat domain-containing protein [Gammaproteobacteria bacterium]|nr:ankyrin repeat domain-containing protein [Gammaproteobacteria bacterium]
MNKDYVLLAIVTVMSIGANLPDTLAGLSGLDRKLLVAGLLLVVTIALVRHSKFALILAVAILSVGANLPQEIAATLNIEPRILLITLAAIVLFSLANRIFKLPSGLDKKQGFISDEGSKALFRAVANRRIRIARRIIDAGTNVNVRSQQGYTPLMIAASHGHDEIVRMLLQKGADLTAVDAEGRNALQIAREADRRGSINMLLVASKAEVADATGALPAT